MRWKMLGLLVLLTVTSTGRSAGAEAPLLSSSSLDALAGTFRGFLIDNVPHVLFEEKKNWGNTKRVANGVTWHGLKPRIQHKDKLHGRQQRIVAWSLNLPRSLVFDLSNLQEGPTSSTFDAFLAFDSRVEIEDRNWRSGVRVASRSVKARFRVRLAMKCEVTTRFETGDSYVPDVLFRLRVLKADLKYDNLVFEHIGGMGGEMAELLGKGVQGGLRLFHPRLEEELLKKGNRAIVRTADTKEVRISLSKLLGS